MRRPSVCGVDGRDATRISVLRRNSWNDALSLVEWYFEGRVPAYQLIVVWYRGAVGDSPSLSPVPGMM